MDKFQIKTSGIVTWTSTVDDWRRTHWTTSCTRIGRNYWSAKSVSVRQMRITALDGQDVVVQISLAPGEESSKEISDHRLVLGLLVWCGLLVRLGVVIVDCGGLQDPNDLDVSPAWTGGLVGRHESGTSCRAAAAWWVARYAGAAPDKPVVRFCKYKFAWV